MGMLRFTLLIALFLITTFNVEARTLWEPCKIQCDNNFAKNDINQEKLISVCHRGCDMFTVALISTTQSENFRDPDEVQGPKALPSQVDLKPEGLNSQNIESNFMLKHLFHNCTRTHLLPTFEDGSQEKSKEIDNELSNPTSGPLSQPVQDHPVEANEHSTTTNGPKRTQLESMRKDILKELEKERPDAISIKFVETKVNIMDENEQVPQDAHSHENTEKREEDRVESAKHSCRHACVTAYGGVTEQEACVVGCHLQATTAIQKSHSSTTITLTQPFYKSPLAMMQKMFFNLAGQVGHLVRLSWSSSSSHQETQDNVQVFGSEDMNPSAQVSFFEGLKPRVYIMDPNDKKDGDSSKTESYYGLKTYKTEIFRFPKLFSQTITLKNSKIPEDISRIFKKEHLNRDIEVPHHQQHHFMFTKDHDRDHHNQNIIQQIPPQQQQQLDLLECISRKSGLPRWLIATTIFASALVVLWLCFSLTAPPEDIRVVKTNVKSVTEGDRIEDSEDSDIYDDDIPGVGSEKKSLIPRNDDVIKIRIENV